MQSDCDFGVATDDLEVIFRWGENVLFLRLPFLLMGVPMFRFSSPSMPPIATSDSLRFFVTREAWCFTIFRNSSEFMGESLLSFSD